MYKIECERCNLYKNGLYHPYIGEDVKYVIIGESPASSAYSLTPPDSKFWGIMASYGFTKSQFGVINSINCYNKNKPSEYHRERCLINISKFVERLDPELIISCGNFALHTLTGKWGINNYVNKISNRILFKKKRKIMYWKNTNTINYDDSLIKSMQLLKEHTDG